MNFTSELRNISIETLEHYNKNTDYGNYTDNPKVDYVDRILLLPIAPENITFDEGSNSQTVDLLNYGEYPVSMNRKLAKWNVTSLFPNLNDSNLPYVHYPLGDDGNVLKLGPYNYYCDTLLYWKKQQTPLVFRYKLWGDYYNCQIEDFKFSSKDFAGWVTYTIDFKEYKKLTENQNDSYKNRYSAKVYYPAKGDDIISICQKCYGSANAYKYFMKLNGMTNILITPGKEYKLQ